MTGPLFPGLFKIKDYLAAWSAYQRRGWDAVIETLIRMRAEARVQRNLRRVCALDSAIRVATEHQKAGVRLGLCRFVPAGKIADPDDLDEIKSVFESGGSLESWIAPEEFGHFFVYPRRGRPAKFCPEHSMAARALLKREKKKRPGT